MEPPFADVLALPPDPAVALAPLALACDFAEPPLAETLAFAPEPPVVLAPLALWWLL